MQKVLKSYLEYLCGAKNVGENVLLSTKTTFQIGGAAKFFVTVRSREVLLKLLSALNYIEEPWFIIGAGANLLAPDKGFDGVVIKLGFDEIVQNGAFLYADAGCSLGKLAMEAQRRLLSGLEWLVGIPGTVGGGVYMNAGAYGGSFSDCCVCVDVLRNDEEGFVIETIDAPRLKFAYRKSIFQRRKNWVILGAYFHLSHGVAKDIQAKMNENNEKRRKSIPTQPSGGSTFRKPAPDFYVGTTIERLGFKGGRIGGAMVSDKHAGIIVNVGGATEKDVLELAKKIKKVVFDETGARLELEYERISKKIQRVTSGKKQSFKPDCP